MPEQANKSRAPAARRSKPGGKADRAAPDWRVDALARIRALIAKADPRIVETRKWRKPSNAAGVPTWSRGGIICTGETCRDQVKLTFARGAALADPHGLFNASLAGNTRRAIDIRQNDRLDEAAFKALVRAAVALDGRNDQHTGHPRQER